MDNYPRPDGVTLLDMFKRMTLIRQNDERSHKVIRSGQIAMPYYSPRGQEVIPSDISVNLNDDDYVCTIYRVATQINIVQAVNQALDHAMAEDPSILVLGEDIADKEEGGVMVVTKGLSIKCGGERALHPDLGAGDHRRVFGRSQGGSRDHADFTTVAMDMIVNHAAKLRFMSGGQTHVPIVIRTMTGAGFSVGGQHSDYLEAWFAHTAGIKVVAPSNPADAYGLLLSCLDDPDPCMFIENLPLYWTNGVAPEPGVRIPLGKAKVVVEGTDVTLIAHSRMVIEALAAAKALAGEGVSAEVIDLRTISPWDRETVLASVGKTGRALIVHEANRQFGIGGEIGEHLFGALKAPVGRLGGAECAVSFSKPLEDAFAPSRKTIADAARAHAGWSAHAHEDRT